MLAGVGGSEEVEGARGQTRGPGWAALITPNRGQNIACQVLTTLQPHGPV